MPSFTRYNTKHSSLNMIHALLYIILEVTGTCINDIKKMAFYFNDRKNYNKNNVIEKLKKTHTHK